MNAAREATRTPPPVPAEWERRRFPGFEIAGTRRARDPERAAKALEERSGPPSIHRERDRARSSATAPSALLARLSGRAANRQLQRQQHPNPDPIGNAAKTDTAESKCWFVHRADRPSTRIGKAPRIFPEDGCACRRGIVLSQVKKRP